MKTAVLIILTLALAPVARGQQAEALSPWQEPVLQLPGHVTPPPQRLALESAERKGPMAVLYRALRATPLDPARVFHVREAVLERGELHLYLTDGTIAFTQDVDGRATGAYFEGEGEVLMRPPDLTEHASLGLFSGLGVLDEHFAAAYLRFNSDVMGELKPFLRESEERQEFQQAHNAVSRELAGMDALRLLASFTEDATMAAGDRFLHARLATRLGSLDVYDDSEKEDQFEVARLSRSGANSFFDVWMAFPGRDVRGLGDRRAEPANSNWAVLVENFKIDSVLTPPETLEATAELDITVKDGGQRLLSFELSRWLQVTKVAVDGADVEFLQNDALNGTELERIGNDLVTVVMPAVLHAGDHHRLRFRYAGAVMQQAAPGLLYVGARGTWYPNRGVQMSHFNLKFRWPRDWTLVATGQRTSLREDGGMHEGEWNSEEKIPIAGFNLGKFARALAKTDGVEVASYSAGVVEQSLAKASEERSREASATNEAIARRSAEAIEKYVQWFGPYPYKSLAITQLPGPMSQGWPTLLYLTSFAYLTGEERKSLRLSRFEQLLYSGFMQDHETAHQWWGDRVGWKSYRDQWLMEGLANLSALMIMEESHPEEARELLEQYRSQLLATNANGKRYADAGPVTLGYRLSSSVFPNAYIPVTYGRGLWLLVMLRDYFDNQEKLDAASAHGKSIERGRFRAALREFGRRYERNTATTEDFRKVMEEFLPPNARYEGSKTLQWFFDEWVRGSSVPRIEMKRLTFRRRADVTFANFDLEQQECPESLVTAVPIYAESADGKRVLLREVYADGHQAHFELKVPEGTRRLLADPEKRLLRLY